MRRETKNKKDRARAGHENLVSWPLRDHWPYQGGSFWYFIFNEMGYKHFVAPQLTMLDHHLLASGNVLCDGGGWTRPHQYHTIPIQYWTAVSGLGWAGASSGASQLIWMESRQKYTAQPSTEHTLELQTKVLNHRNIIPTRPSPGWKLKAPTCLFHI